jgi:hypothetical protein
MRHFCTQQTTPDIVVNFFDADRLTGEDGAEVDLFAAEADASATRG